MTDKLRMLASPLRNCVQDATVTGWEYTLTADIALPVPAHLRPRADSRKHSAHYDRAGRCANRGTAMTREIRLAITVCATIAAMALLCGCATGEFCKAQYGLDAFGCTCGECTAKRLQAIEKRMEEGK